MEPRARGGSGGRGWIHGRVARHAAAARDQRRGAIVVDPGEASELAARVRLFRGHGPRPTLRGRTVILVDDGIATGGTVSAALGAMRREGAKKIVLAVPVADLDSLARLAERADEVVCLAAPHDLDAVGNWYEDFPQVTDEEALALLERARRRRTRLVEEEAR